MVTAEYPYDSAKFAMTDQGVRLINRLHRLIELAQIKSAVKKMGPRKELRRRLEAKRNNEIQQASQQLLTNAGADVEASLKRIETYSKLLASMEPHASREWLWAGLTALVCVLGAAVLWSFRVSGTKISLQIQTEAVEMTLAAPWSWSGDLPLDMKRLRFEGLTAIEAPVLERSIDNPGEEAWLHLQGGNLALKQMALNDGGVLSVERTSAGDIDLYARRAQFSSLFLVWGSAHLWVGEGYVGGSRQLEVPLKELQIPETIRVRSTGVSAVPTRFILHPRNPWILRDLPVRELRFAREIPAEPGAVSFLSAIRQGTLTLHDIAETATLHAKDRLTLTAVKGRVVELRIADTIDLTFEGTANQIKIGPEGFAQNRAPRYLEFFFHQKPLVSFLGAIASFWGVLWGIRKTIFR
jgi:hypothetical protein